MQDSVNKDINQRNMCGDGGNDMNGEHEVNFCDPHLIFSYLLTIT
jgi:hypothetical protein